jgi:hypothetical protein
MLLLQWHTVSPIDRQSGAWIAAAANEIGLKQMILTAVEKVILTPRANPMFVVTPELSLPLALVPAIDSVVAKASKPLVFIAGLEHMTLEQYATLAADFDDATTAMNPQTNRRVNAAAIWIVTNTGSRRYLQMKRGLADSEQNDLTHGREAFLFASPDQRDGRRLNFAVGICADFTNKQHVLQLRREMAKHPDVLALDLMFLLQMNENQDALQFRTAVAAYFDPPEPGGEDTRTRDSRLRPRYFLPTQRLQGARCSVARRACRKASEGCLSAGPLLADASQYRDEAQVDAGIELTLDICRRHDIEPSFYYPSTTFDFPRCFQVATIVCHSNCRRDKTDLALPDWVYERVEGAGIRLVS